MKKAIENQGSDYDASLEDVILIRDEDGKMKHVEVSDDDDEDN